MSNWIKFKSLKDYLSPHAPALAWPTIVYTKVWVCTVTPQIDLKKIKFFSLLLLVLKNHVIHLEGQKYVIRFLPFLPVNIGNWWCLNNMLMINNIQYQPSMDWNMIN